jgi:methionine transaminase
LAESPKHVEQLSSFYQEKRDVLVKALAGSRFKILPSSGTYFLLVDYSEISDLNDYDFCYWMAKEIGVVAVPLSPFYETPTQDKIIRICFAKFDETLVEAGERMGRL